MTFELFAFIFAIAFFGFTLISDKATTSTRVLWTLGAVFYIVGTGYRIMSSPQPDIMYIIMLSLISIALGGHLTRWIYDHKLRQEINIYVDNMMDLDSDKLAMMINQQKYTKANSIHKKE